MNLGLNLFSQEDSAPSPGVVAPRLYKSTHWEGRLVPSLRYPPSGCGGFSAEREGKKGGDAPQASLSMQRRASLCLGVPCGHPGAHITKTLCPPVEAPCEALTPAAHDTHTVD